MSASWTVDEGAVAMTESRHVVCAQCGGVNRVPVERLGAGGRCGRCKAPLFQAKPVAVDAAAFRRQFERSDIPLLVDFWAPWCGPCKMMAPAFEQAAGLLEPGFRLLKVNTEEQQALAAQFGIRSIPTLMVFAGGREVGRLAGAMDTNGIVAWARQQVG
jgi:thioredoxin 2